MCGCNCHRNGTRKQPVNTPGSWLPVLQRRLQRVGCLAWLFSRVWVLVFLGIHLVLHFWLGDVSVLKPHIFDHDQTERICFFMGFQVSARLKPGAFSPSQEIHFRSNKCRSLGFPPFVSHPCFSWVVGDGSPKTVYRSWGFVTST